MVIQSLGHFAVFQCYTKKIKPEFNDGKSMFVKYVFAEIIKFFVHQSVPRREDMQVFLVGVFEENPDSYSGLFFFVSSTRNIHFLCINAINAHLPTFTICT